MEKVIKTMQMTEDRRRIKEERKEGCFNRREIENIIKKNVAMAFYNEKEQLHLEKDA